MYSLALQVEARAIAEQERRKPDTEYVMEDGRLPLPNGILHNGELWRVGTLLRVIGWWAMKRANRCR